MEGGGVGLEEVSRIGDKAGVVVDDDTEGGGQGFGAVGRAQILRSGVKIPVSR
jgi:hypothetical protein